MYPARAVRASVPVARRTAMSAFCRHGSISFRPILYQNASPGNGPATMSPKPFPPAAPSGAALAQLQYSRPHMHCRAGIALPTRAKPPAPARAVWRNSRTKAESSQTSGARARRLPRSRFRFAGDFLQVAFCQLYLLELRIDVVDRHGGELFAKIGVAAFHGAALVE